MDTQAVPASAAKESGSVLAFQLVKNKAYEIGSLGACLESTKNTCPLAWSNGSNTTAPVPSNSSQSGVADQEFFQGLLRQLEEARSRLHSQSRVAATSTPLHFGDKMLLTGVRERLQLLGRKRRAAARASIEAELASIDFGTAEMPKPKAPNHVPPPGLRAVDVEFMMNVRHRLKRMSPENRSLALCKIQRVLHQIEFGS